MRRSRGVGRPPKFDEARRPVTVTLPERTLERLAVIHEDRAHAIVKAVDAALQAPAGGPAVQLVEVAPGSAVIIVGPSRTLARIPFLRLVEVAAGRHLLAIPPGTPIDTLELALVDALETLPPNDAAERGLVNALRAQLQGVRQSQSVTKAEIMFVTTDARPGRRRRG